MALERLRPSRQRLRGFIQDGMLRFLTRNISTDLLVVFQKKKRIGEKGKD
jgi:hypothetical protein